MTEETSDGEPASEQTSETASGQNANRETTSRQNTNRESPGDETATAHPSDGVVVPPDGSGEGDTDPNAVQNPYSYGAEQEATCAGRCGDHHIPACDENGENCIAPPYGAPPMDETLV